MRRCVLLLCVACATAPRATRVALAVTDQIGMQVPQTRGAEGALAEALEQAGVQPTTALGDFLVTGVAVSQRRGAHGCMVQLKVKVRDVAKGVVLAEPSATEPGGGRDEQACALDGARRAAASIAPRLVELMQKQKP